MLTSNARRARLIGALHVVVTIGSLLLTTVVDAAIELKLQGVGDPEVRRQLLAYIGPPPEDSADGLEDFVRDLGDKARRALQAVGYYAAKIEYETVRQEAQILVLVNVQLGMPVLVKAINLRVEGDAGEDEAFQRLLGEPGMAVGDTLDHGKYEAIKDKLLELTQRRGYFAARFLVQRVAVSRAERSAVIDLVLLSGVRHVFGDITFDATPIDSEQLPRWLPFSRDTPYHADLVAAGTNALRDTGYFSHVRLVLQHEQVRDGRIPVHVQLQPAAPNKVSFGVGFATDTGPRARATWDKPYLNSDGHSLRTEIAASRVRSSLGASYRIPSVTTPARRYYQLEAALHAEDYQDTQSTSRTAAMRRVTDTESGWRQDAYLRWQNETFEVGADRNTSNMYIPGIGYTHYERGASLRARQGARYGVRLEGASRDLLSDVDMQKIVANGKWLWPFQERHRVIVRADLGALATNDFDRLPSTERFFTGGDQSVRGFGYRSIAPEDDNGVLIGGRYLNVASAEFVWQYTPSWGLAVFTDTGRAYNERDEPFRVGVGFGLRWQSPIGTLRVDLGFGVSEDTVPTRLHLTFGPDL
ncbi:MAG: autotransporter assembly complex protein TamA [Gammaproteobacteria bacterium]|nr:autotransporter assembly complex protein TamA [Gammaproteobacteria bacterium]